jgi:hypothetical protein
MDTTYLHIGMILSTLGLSPHEFALGLYPKGLIPMEIFVHPYIPMILLISSQCGTLVVYPTNSTMKMAKTTIISNNEKSDFFGNNQDCKDYFYSYCRLNSGEAADAVTIKE